MPEKIFFQWQNKTLLETIYPKRKEKLIDFLLHFEEIELWKRHEKMPKDEFERRKKQYEEKQAEVLEAIVKVYNKEKNYFLDTAAKNDTNKHAVALYARKYKDLKEGAESDELERVKNLHASFQLINPEGKNIYKDDIRKERIFVAQRVMIWEEYRKKVADLIVRQRRRVNSIQANAWNAQNKGLDKLKGEYQAKAAEAQKELDRLENQLLKMVDDEMAHLKALSSAYVRYEKRKLTVIKTKEKYQDELGKKLGELGIKRREVRQAEEELRAVQGWIRRFKNAQSSDNLGQIMESMESILLGVVDWGGIEEVFDKETKFLERYMDIRKYYAGILQGLQGEDVKLAFVNRWMESLSSIKVDIDGKIDKLETDGGQKELIQSLQLIMSRVLVPELDKLADYHFALDRIVDEKIKKTSATLLEEKRAKENQIQKEKQIQKALKEGRAALVKLEKEIAPIRARLAIPDEDELVKYDPEKDIAVNDIVIELAKEYRESLVNKTHEELLEIVVRLFWDNPEKYPLWLQYMVIHFSGMRYASAHGSWADPKELLGNLLASTREEENRALATDEDEVDNQADAWLRYLQSNGEQVEVEGDEPITLPLSKLKDDEKDEEKKKTKEDDTPRIASFIAELEGNFYTKRKALHNLKLLQDKYKIEAMSHEDVLEELKEIHEEKDKDGNNIIPDWMWSEIVAMTDLRIEEAKKPNWEKLSPEQEVEKNSGKWEKYRAIMNEWKAKNLTDWRKEHESSGGLIVTRAVCNEVAEHIQHMRGHEGAAGLTEKPNWYKREEREFNEKWPRWKGEYPYFKRPRLDSDFKEGASLLWLRYVRDFPNEWRIAQPLETEEGDGLIREEYLRKRAPGNWTYSLEDGIPRKRSLSTPGAGKPETQYLRWMHEATVAAVAKTAEGTVVLTFETALPYEDRRLSTIGVFKRYPYDLMDDFGEDGYNPAFVGFVPEGELSEEKLKIFREMLDWNKILLKEFKSQAELAAYQEKYIRSRYVPPHDVQGAGSPSGIETIKDLREERKRALRILENPDYKFYRARNWGDPILVEQAGLSAEVAKTSNFNPLPLWSDSGTWSAITNALIIPRDDIERLVDLQVQDTMKLKNKMNWLVYSGYAKRPYWCSELGEWNTTPQIWWGTILFGGQLVLTDGDETFFTKLPEEQKKRRVPMKRIVCFRKLDWGVTHDTHPWLIQLATEVDHRDRFNSTPKGAHIYSPLWSPLDWDYAGKHQPKAFYVPTDWLIPCPHLERFRNLASKKISPITNTSSGMDESYGPPISTVQ